MKESQIDSNLFKEEKEGHLSAKEFPEILQTAPIMIYEVGSNGRVIGANDAVLKWSGYSKEELASMENQLQLLTPDSREKFTQRTRAILETGRIEPDVEYDFVIKDGSIRTVVLNTKIRLKDGKFIGALVVAYDITERRKTEEALRESEERFSKAFLANPTAMAISSLDGQIVDVNSSFEKLMGYSRDEVLGKLGRTLSLCALASARDKLIQKLKEGAAVHNYEIRFRHRSGKPIDTLFSLEKIVLKGQQYFLGTAIDVTERKIAEEALRLSEEKFQKAFQNSPIGVTLTRLSDGAIIEANNAALTFLGYSLKEVIGRKTLELGMWVNPKDRSKIVEELASKGSVNNQELTLRGKDGNLFSVLLSASILTIQSEKFFISTLLDITERKKAEKALIESEELYRTLFENSIDGFMLLEPIFNEGNEACDFRFLKLNKAYERQTGAKAEDVLGKLASEVTPKLETEIVFLSGEVVKKQESIRKEMFNKYSNKWFDSYYFSYSQGKVGILFRDITLRKQVEEGLMESEGKYRALVETTNTGYLIIDREGRVIDANPEYVRLTGYRELGEILGRSVIEWTADYEKQKNEAAIRQCVRDGFIKDLVIDYVDKNGRITPVEINAAVIGAGDATRIISLCRDITERKKAEEKLKQSEEQLRVQEGRLSLIYDNVPEILYSISVEADSRFRFTSVNCTFLQATGLREDQVVGKVVQEVIPEPSLSLVLKKYNEAIKNKKAVSWEEITVYPSGKKYGEVTVAPLFDSSGRCIFLIGNVHDITERKAMEKQLQDNERLAAIGQTAGMVGHDIRNPLQAVMSDTFLLRDELASMPECTNKEGVTESIDSIERNVAYINKIVQDLQDFARPIIPEYSTVSLSDVIVHVFETIGVPELIKLSVNVKDAEKITVDPTLLQRAIANLVNNAIQAMPEGGKLEVCGEKKDSRIVVTVSDSGVGISDEIKPKLFTPMITTKAKGQGFGLAASKRIIEAMKGTISFESEIGKGTKFIIELPIDIS